MARAPRGVGQAEASHPIPRYPLAPTSLEIHVIVAVRGGVVVKWEGAPAGGDTRSTIEDGENVTVDQAKGLLLARQIQAGSLPPDERTVTVRGSPELVEHAMERAHRATVLLVEDEALPGFLHQGWESGKIGVPKGVPPVRQVNLHRPGE